MFGRIASILTLLSLLLVPALALPPTAALAQAPATPWYSEYYNNTSLIGPPIVTRYETNVNYDWGVGAPVAGLPADNFSVRWTAPISFAAGEYDFFTVTDDGVRLFVDNVLVIDHWAAQSATTWSAHVNLSGGTHVIRMEYFEATVTAVAKLYWQQATVAHGGNILTCMAPAPHSSWIKIFRRQGGQWVDINPHGWGRIADSGFLKIDGIAVDAGVYGSNGEPYLVQVWVDGHLAHEVGDTDKGEPSFRVFAGRDNGTPWACPVT